MQAMGDFLLESGYRANRPSIVTTLMRGSSAKYETDMNTMNNLVDEREYPSTISFISQSC